MTAEVPYTCLAIQARARRRSRGRLPRRPLTKAEPALEAKLQDMAYGDYSYILATRLSRHYGRVVKATDSNSIRNICFPLGAQVQVLLVSFCCAVPCCLRCSEKVYRPTDNDLPSS